MQKKEVIMKLVYDSKLSLEKELLLLEKLGQIKILDNIKSDVKPKQRTRGNAYSDIHCLFMVFLKGLGWTKQEMGVYFGTNWKTVTNCIVKGYKIIKDDKHVKKGRIVPISKRVKIISVGNTTDLELLEGIKRLSC